VPLRFGVQMICSFSVDQALKHPWVVYEGQEGPSTTNKKLFSVYPSPVGCLRHFAFDCVVARSCVW
jgi:hypothetical protein